MYRICLLAAALFGSLFVSNAQAQTLAHEPPPPETAKLLAALSKPMPAAHYQDTELRAVVSDWSRQTGIPIVIDLRALDDIGLAGDVPVSRKLPSASLRSTMNLILRDFELTWTIRDEVLLITTHEEAESELETKIYDVSRLVELVAYDPAGFGPGGFGSGGSGQVAYDYDYDTLIELITATISPVTWDFVGGPGSVDGFTANNVRALVVSQTLPIHEQVDRLLEKLHQLGGHPSPRLRPLRTSTARQGKSPSIHRAASTSAVWNPRGLPMTKSREQVLRQVPRASSRAYSAAPAWLRPVSH